MSLRDVLNTYKRKTVKTTFCNEEVELMELSGLEFSEFSEKFDNEKDWILKSTLIIAYTICENGKRLFSSSEQDLKTIAQAPLEELKRLAKEASILIGMRSDDDDEEERAEKNS